MKVFGQIFFRTPIRVMEVGVRMTPGVQFFAPKYLEKIYKVKMELEDRQELMVKHCLDIVL